MTECVVLALIGGGPERFAGLDPASAESTAAISVLVVLTVLAEAERVVDRHPFFRSTVFERRMLFARAPAAVALRSAA